MIWEVARREIVVRSRTKTFRLITMLLVGLAAAGVIAATIFTGDGNELREVNMATVGEFTAQPLLEQLSADVLDLEIAAEASLDEAEAMLESGDLKVIVVDNDELVWDRWKDFELEALISSALRQEQVIANAGDLGLSPDQLAQLMQPPDLAERFLDEADEAEGIKTAAALIGVIATFLLIQVYGSLVAMGVVEEKASRVIEVLLSHMEPRTLLIGKILGVGLLALAQAALVMGVVAVTLLITNDLNIPGSVWGSMPLILASMLLGFAFYACAFGASGSLVSRTEDAQQVMLPVLAPLLVGYLASTAMLENPDSLLAKILTLVPFTMPVILPLRAALGEVAVWEIALAFGLLILGTFIMLRLAARLYEFTLLRTGTRVGWLEALRLARD